MGAYTIEERLDWRRWVTPRPLEEKPVHRWYVFPHSFTSELVHALIAEWKLQTADKILDPFAGAGTTLLAAREKGISAAGYDLSPLATLAAQVKIEDYSVEELETAWCELDRKLKPRRWNGANRKYPELVRKALPGRLLSAFETVDKEIANLQASAAARNFFRLALLSLIPSFSRAVATGGWLKWVNSGKRADSLPRDFGQRVRLMLDDLRTTKLPNGGTWKVGIADARAIPESANAYAAVITSPPYPNRHDYTRVFGVELLFGFLDWNATRDLRYQSFHSHPEARPERPAYDGYSQPSALAAVLDHVRENARDRRVHRMIDGYFLDTFLSLREAKRLCRPGGRIAWVVGNAQYCGKALPVDELTAEIGEQAGLTCERLLVVRYRGNSSQQMGRFGRNPSRESIVVFRRS